jgi:hypothetical protein
VIEIHKPDKSIQVNRLDEGQWYWTVEAQGVNGRASVAVPRSLTVLSVLPLPAPGNRLPRNGHRFNTEEFRESSAIVFSWQAVPNANAYIFTIYQQTSDGRQQIIRRAPENRLSWTLEDFNRLGRQGTFIWQVEAVTMNRDGEIEQRGTPGENVLIMDIPRAGAVKVNEPGVLYGN